MTLVRINDYRKHWSKGTLYYNEWIARIMERDSWLKIHRGWSFTKGGTTVDDLINLVNRRFKYLWKPGSKLVLDESMVLFKGKSKYRVKIGWKFYSIGIELILIVDSSRFIYTIELYKRVKEKIIDLVERNIQRLPKLPFDLYMDARFGSEKVAKMLIGYGHRISLSCQANRPSHLFAKRLHQKLDSGIFQSCAQEYKEQVIIATSWREIKDQKKKFNLLSSCCPDSKTKKEPEKPENVLDYAKNMGFVDQANQKIMTNWLWHKSPSWKKVVMIWIFKALIQNSYRIYQIVRLPKISFPEFTESLIRSFGDLNHLQPIEDHQKAKISKRNRTRKRCAWCFRTKRIKSNTSVKCMQCNLPLHSETCFQEFHNLLQYQKF